MTETARGEGRPTRRRASVRVLLVLLLFCVLIPILVLQLHVYQRSYRARRAGEAQAGLEVARAVAASFDAYVATLRTEAKAAGYALVLLAPYRREQAMWYMAQLKQARPEVLSVSWLQPNGLVFASSDKSLVNTMWPERSWRRQLLHGQSCVVTDATRTDDARGSRFSIVQSARDRTKSLRGIVVLVLDPTRLGETVRIRRSGQGGISLVDASGWLVVRYPTLPHHGAREWGHRFPEVHRALEGKEATGTAAAPAGQERWIVAEAPVASTGWAAGADRPEQAALASIRAEISDSALVFALVTAFGLLLAIAAARLIAGPLQQLRNSARMIGSGSGGGAMPVSGPAEVADLASALNRMAQEIRRRQQEREQLQAQLVGAEHARAEAAETLNREIGHRTRNNLAMAAGLLQVQLARESDPLVVTALQEAISRLSTFADLHQQLGVTAEGEVELLRALRRLADSLQGVFRTERISISVGGDEITCPGAFGTNLCVIANELITNAIKHGAPGPDGQLRVRVSLERAAGALQLSVWNSGNPISADLDVTQGQGMGMSLVQNLVVEQYRGSFSLTPHEGGTLAQVLADDEQLRERV